MTRSSIFIKPWLQTFKKTQNPTEQPTCVVKENQAILYIVITSPEKILSNPPYRNGTGMHGEDDPAKSCFPAFIMDHFSE